MRRIQDDEIKALADAVSLAGNLVATFLAHDDYDEDGGNQAAIDSVEEAFRVVIEAKRALSKLEMRK